MGMHIDADCHQQRRSYFLRQRSVGDEHHQHPRIELHSFSLYHIAQIENERALLSRKDILRVLKMLVYL